MHSNMPAEKIRKPSLTEACMPIVFLIGMLVFNVMIYRDDAISGSNQMVLLLSAAFAALLAFIKGAAWADLLKGAVKSIKSSLSAILILMLIGSLAGTWLLSGIVPAIIYYGLQVLNAKIFLFAACVVCCIVSLTTGSSWSTTGTIGIALMGIGQALGLPEGMVAGAIISGAYFGDKMSPLSDTTNLAPAMAGTDIFTHIRYMTITTIPSLLIALLIFIALGFSGQASGAEAEVTPLLSAIGKTFHITPWLFIVPALVIGMIIMRVPPLPALLTGALLGGVFAVVFQPHIIREVSGIEGNYFMAAYVAVMDAMSRTISVTTENEVINELLTTGGMGGMMTTIWLIICAMTFGGVMEAAGYLKRISSAVITLANSSGSLIAATAGTCVFFNITASDQYLAIVVPGRMYKNVFKEEGLMPENLSRTLEDSGTVTSVLVPWNTGGAYNSRVLGVPTLTYLPYCFFNLISPLMTVLVGFIGYKIRKINASEKS
ncbi:MAG: Na+/H+ antiporter NhaC [Flavobacteriales bacterium]